MNAWARRAGCLLLMLVACAPVVAGSLRGTVTCTGAPDGANAVVYVERIEGKTFAPPEKSAEIDQKDTTFIPRVLPVLVGTKVAFLNNDAFNHNVYSPDNCAGSFDLGQWSKGEVRSHVFDKPCEAVIFCNIHPAMIAYVIVVETPYFAVTDAAGHFSIADMPDGTYTVSTWHERLKKQSRSVTVKGATTADFTLTR